METVVNITPTGMVPSRSMTPHVPISVNEIVEQVHEAYGIGVTTLHLHARGEDELPTCKAEVYGKLIEGIRKYAPELVICVSLSGRNFKEFEQRAEPILHLDGNAKPDMGSLTLSSLNFSRQESLNSPEMVQRLATTMLERGIVAELEAFDVGMINYIKYLIKKGMIKPPYYANLFVGNIASAQLNLVHLGAMLHDLPPDTIWAVGGIGEAQLPSSMIAIAMGGGVRIGLEDNIYYEGDRLATNAQLLNRIHRIAFEAGRSVMTSNKFREIMNMKLGGDDGYGREA